MSASDLTSLLIRVEKAEGADRELLVALGEALFIDFAPSPAWWKKFTRFIDAGAWTDAALALCKRLYPDVFFHVSRFSRDGGAEAHLYPNRRIGDDYKAEAKTPALALLAALLKAKIAEASHDQ